MVVNILIHHGQESLDVCIQSIAWHVCGIANWVQAHVRQHTDGPVAKLWSIRIAGNGADGQPLW